MATAAPRQVCVIVPAYREAARIGAVVGRIRQHGYVLVVDDGSDDGTAAAAEAAGAEVIRHGTNRGKGVALNTGFQYARERGFDIVITMDGDGQHDPDDIPAFLSAYARTGDAVIIGNRMDCPVNMPFVRRMTNRFMSWLLSRQMGQQVPDSQSGFRLYGAAALPHLTAESARYAAESEVLLALARRGVRIGAVPIRVIYRDERSKIHPLADTIRFFDMLRRWRRGAGGEGDAK